MRHIVYLLTKGVGDLSKEMVIRMNNQENEGQAKRKGKSKTDSKLLPIIEGAIAGDQAALEELCTVSIESVMFRASKIMYNRADAEDVAQETLLKMCSYIHKLKDPMAFHDWLTTILLNESRLKMRNNAKHKDILNFEQELENLFEESEECIPGAYLEAAETREEVSAEINASIGRLPMRQRQATLLHYFDGMDVVRIAEMMGVSHSAVSQNLKIARNKIRSDIESAKGWSFGSRASGGFAAMLPLGGLISDALNMEKLIMQVDPQWMAQALERCYDAALIAGAAGATGVVIAEGAAVASGTVAAASGVVASGTVASGGTAAVSSGVTTAATAATATTGGVAAIVGTCAAIAASVVITVSVAAGSIAYSPQSYEPSVPISTNVAAEIRFSSDESLPHVNPISAEKLSESTHGELLVLGWEIVAADSDETLYYGDGAVVEGIFSQMLERGEYGIYDLVFQLEDAFGTVYSLRHNFSITW